MTQTQLESIAAVLAGRHYLYSLFHQVFSQQPQKELLDLLCSPLLPRRLGCLPPTIRTPWPKALNGCRACPRALPTRT